MILICSLKFIVALRVFSEILKAKLLKIEISLWQNSNIGTLLGRKLSIAFFNLFGLEAKPFNDHSDSIVMFSFLHTIVQLMLCGRAVGNQLIFNREIFFTFTDSTRWNKKWKISNLTYGAKNYTVLRRSKLV